MFITGGGVKGFFEGFPLDDLYFILFGLIFVLSSHLLYAELPSKRGYYDNQWQFPQPLILIQSCTVCVNEVLIWSGRE